METLTKKILNHYNGKCINKTFSFGKIAYRSKKKINPVDVTISLHVSDGKIEFTASGNIWNHIHTDIYCGGQCLDTIAEYIHSPKFKTIHRLWKSYHLNTMHAGTKEQEDLINEYFKIQNKSYDYYEAKKLLEENNLLTVKLLDGTDYTYGTGWLYRGIPENDLEIILDLLEVKKDLID